MRHDRLRPAAVTMRPLGCRCHCERAPCGCRLFGSVRDARFGSALINMLVEPDRILRHAGHDHEWCDKNECHVFHGILRGLIEVLTEKDHRNRRAPLIQINGSIILIECANREIIPFNRPPPRPACLKSAASSPRFGTSIPIWGGPTFALVDLNASEPTHGHLLTNLSWRRSFGYIALAKALRIPA